MKKYTLFLSLILIVNCTHAQTTDGFAQKADASKTGNKQDVLTNFYQLSLKNIFSKNGELSFSSTLFGLKKKLDSNVSIDTRYSSKLNRFERNVQFNATGKMDSANNISSLGIGVTLGLINKRDITEKSERFATLQPYLPEIVIFQDSARQIAVEKFLREIEVKNSTDHEVKRNIKLALIDASATKFTTSLNVKDLDTDFVAALKEIELYDKYVADVDTLVNGFKYVLKDIQRQPLWTVGANYKNHPTLGNRDTLILQSDFIVGFGDIRKKFWEFTANANYKACHLDTFSNNNSWIHTEAGLNKVLMQDEDGNSKMEFKFFGSYDQCLKKGSKPDIAANITFRAAIMKDLWFPVTIKYDPKNGNLLGFLSITYNIDKYKGDSKK